MGLGMVFFWLVIGGTFLLVLAGVAVLVYWLIMQARGVDSPAGGAALGEIDPIELARRRYAHGEITREEYLALREDLKV